MKHFRFFLEGENFPLPQEGSEVVVDMGWFAPRRVQATTLDAAMAKVMSDIRRHPRLAAVPPGSGAIVSVHEARRINAGQAGAPREALSFYRMPPSGPKQNESAASVSI
mgnify:CR=1 FL=1